MSLTRTRSSVALDGEPRMFPGIVSKNARRSSVRVGAVEEGKERGVQGDGEAASDEES